MQIDYDGLAEREPTLFAALVTAAEDNLAAPFALVLMALDAAEDKIRQSGSGQRITGAGFLRELRELATEYVVDARGDQ